MGKVGGTYRRGTESAKRSGMSKLLVVQRLRPWVLNKVRAVNERVVVLFWAGSPPVDACTLHSKESSRFGTNTLECTG
jgi:hypothetical protein